MNNVLIIGATSKIAKEIARALIKHEEVNFILWGRDSKKLEIIKQDLSARGAEKIEIICHDLNDLNVHKYKVEEIWSQWTKIDLVVLAHGTLGDPKKAEVDQSEMLDLIQSNFISHASLLTYISPKLINQKSGSIVVLSSVAGDRGKQSNYVYGSAKAAMTVFTDGLRNRVNGSGVHVLNVKLGPIDTPMTRDHKKSFLFGKPTPVAKQIIKAVQNKKDIVYLPYFWRYIMWVVCSIPEKIFKKMKL